MKFLYKISLVTLIISSFSTVNAQGDIKGDKVAGEHKVFTCTGCHNNTGLKNAYPSYSVPKIGGQSEEYIIAALSGYKNGERVHATMQGNASSLSDQDIADIAAFLKTYDPN